MGASSNAIDSWDPKKTRKRGHLCKCGAMCYSETKVQDIFHGKMEFHCFKCGREFYEDIGNCFDA